MLKMLFWGLHKAWVGFTRRCPKCETGRMYSSYYTIHKTCPNCGVTLQPYQGDSLGVYAVCYFLSLIPAILAGVLVWFAFHLGPYAALAAFALVSGVILFGFFPHMKGLWVACVYLMTGLEPPRMKGL